MAFERGQEGLQAGNGDNMYQVIYEQPPYMFAGHNPYGMPPQEEHIMAQDPGQFQWYQNDPYGVFSQQAHIMAQGPGQFQWYQHDPYGVAHQDLGQVQGYQHNEPQYAQIADNSPQFNLGGQHNGVMTREAFDGIVRTYLRDSKSKANDKIMSSDMRDNIIRELSDGSYTATIEDLKARAQNKHHIRTKYVWVPHDATPQTCDRMSQLCHGITLTRRPGNLYSSELSAKQCLGIRKRLLTMPGSAETGLGEIEHVQAPVTTQESAFSDFCEAHVGGEKSHKGRDATYAALNSGVSDSFSKTLVTALIAECSTCRLKFAKASAAGRKAEERRQHTRESKKEEKKRAREELGEQDDEQKPAKRPRKRRSASNIPPVPQPGTWAVHIGPNELNTYEPINNEGLFGAPAPPSGNAPMDPQADIGDATMLDQHLDGDIFGVPLSANEPGQFPVNAEAPVNDNNNHGLPMAPLDYAGHFGQFIVNVWDP